ncbi:hypothetical protein Vi05172_g8006 [Venturia inaequalis]|nr:hypothetical protein Vi05172_g8006 [Venturia inaequalis]
MKPELVLPPENAASFAVEMFVDEEKVDFPLCLVCAPHSQEFLAVVRVYGADGAP